MYNFGSRDEYGGGEGGENLPGVPDQSVEEWGGRMIYSCIVVISKDE